MVRFAAYLLLFAVALPVAAAAPRREKATDAKADAEAERLELAREHFLRGEQLEASGELHGALLEFELAELAHPSASVTEAKRRVRDRLEPARPVPVAASASSSGTHPSLRHFIAPIVIAPLALGSLLAGGALLGTVRHDVDQLRHDCAPNCAPSSTDALRVREPVAYALLGIGAGLAAIDAVLWGVLATRRDGERPTARIFPSLGVSGTQGIAGLRGRF
jgi:hypothetical protein